MVSKDVTHRVDLAHDLGYKESLKVLLSVFTLLLCFPCYDDNHDRKNRWGQETSRERTGREEERGKGKDREEEKGKKMQEGEEEKVR